jgi:hypothetical protein
VCCRMQWTHITENLIESMKVYLKRRRPDTAPQAGPLSTQPGGKLSMDRTIFFPLILFFFTLFSWVFPVRLQTEQISGIHIF